MKNHKKLFLAILFFVLYLAFMGFLFFHHENWRDEAQAYLLCRDMNLLEIFSNAHYEGHPILYYVFLYPLVNLGFGPKSVNILSLFFMACSVYLVLFHSKFHWIQKMCVILSYPVLFQYSIVGRSYALLFFLLILFAFLYPKRKEKPILFSVLLGLLLNTHLFMASFVGIISLLFYGNAFLHRKDNDLKMNRKLLISFAVLLLFGVLLLLQFYPMLFSHDGMSTNSVFSFSNYTGLFLTFMFCSHCNRSVIGLFLSIPIMVLLYVKMFKSNKGLFFIYLVFCLCSAFLSEIIWDGVPIYCVAIGYCILLSFFLIIGSDDKIINLCFYLLMFFSFKVSVPIIQSDIKYSYSDAKKTAQYMEKNLDKSQMVLCHEDWLCSSLAPYTNFSFYSYTEERFFTYVIWNQKRENQTEEQLLKTFQKEKHFYFIYCKDLEDEIPHFEEMKEQFSMKKIYESSSPVFTDESFVIYEVGVEL